MNPRNSEHIARALRILRGTEAVTPQELTAFPSRIAAEMARAERRLQQKNNPGTARQTVFHG